MFENITLQYPTYFILFCVLLGVIYAASLYFRHKIWREHTSSTPLLLSILRGLAVAAIAYFLLGPILERFKKRTQDAIVVIAQDNSESIAEGTDSKILTDYQNNLNSLSTSLNEDFEVKTFYFGADISITQDSTTKSTDISKALEHIQNQYSDQHIGAVILATDGIYNEGRNPLYAANSLTAPVYPIALGDTTIRKDITIKHLLYNKIAYLGDKHTIDVDIAGANVTGTKTHVSIAQRIDGKLSEIEKQYITFDSANDFKTVSFEVDNKSVGSVEYVVTVGSVADELSTSNNRKSAYVDVIDARQEIMVIANAPHPDIKAIRSTLNQNKNYRLSIYTAKDANIPVNKADLVIFHNLPSKTTGIDTWLKQMDRKRTPRIYMVGGQSDLAKLNAGQNTARITGVIGQSNEAQASWMADFNQFTLSDKTKRDLVNYPPIMTPFGEYKLTKADVLLKQTISGIKTDYPLLVFAQENNIRSAYLFGEGIWKWRLFNYLQDKNHEVFDELLQKTIQYTSLKDDKRKFRVNIADNNYQVNQHIQFDAQLYNDVYELINTPEASLTIKNSAGKQYDYTFSKGSNYYYLDAGSLAADNYTYTGEVTFNGEKLSSKGKFRIEAIEKESYDLTAKHGLLHQLAEKHDGQVVYPQDIASLEDIIKGNTSMKPVVYQEKDNRMLLNYHWLLLPILLLLFLEWFFRRYTGGY